MNTNSKGYFGKRTLLFILLAFVLLAMPVQSQAKKKGKIKAPKKECHSYVVMDAGSGKVLFGQDENKQIYPASTAKLMTAIVCIENGDVDSKIKTEADIVGTTTPGTYALGIASGVKFTFKDLLHLSLLSSASDATDSLAAGVFGSEKACAEAMNKKCKELGLKKTSFDNPVGSDIGAGFNETYSTATEMAKITRYAMAVPLIRSTVAKSSYTTTSGQDLTVNTTNWFLRGMAWYDDDTYDIIGSKSGTTNAAGHVFIATAMDHKGHEVICAYFGNVSKESTFASIRSLYKYTFDQYKKGNIELSCSNYDIRNKKKLGGVYNEYASLNCFPQNKSGRFEPKKPVTRKELAKMMRGINELKGDKTLKRFVTINAGGKVSTLRLAGLVQELFPNFLNDEEIEGILADCRNVENLTAEEKNAYASFLKAGLAVDGSMKNPGQVVTRKQALLFADLLSAYQFRYAFSHPVGQVKEAADGGMITYPVVTFTSKWDKVLKKQAAEIQKEKEKAAKEAAEEAAKEAAEEASEVTSEEAATTEKPAEGTTAAK